MSGPLFEIVEDKTVGDHRYVRVGPVDSASLAAELAPRVRDYYIDLVQAHARIKAACATLEAFKASGLPASAAIANALVDEVDAALPKPTDVDGAQPSQLDTQRSELAEIIATEVVRDLFDACVPASRIKNKEIPDQATRGADLVALEHRQRPLPVLALCEVKGSTDKSSPPSVVTGMAAKLTTLVTQRRALTQELEWVRDHADDAHVGLLDELVASHLLFMPQFSVLLTPVLLRSAATAAPTDPGKFAKSPEAFGHPIRWISIVVDTDLLELAHTIYALARQVAA